MRLFACAGLVRRAVRYPEQTGSEFDTLARLVSSAIVLGEPVAPAAAGMLAWRFLTYAGTAEDPPFLAFAVLLLAVHVERRGHRGTWLKQPAEWVEAEECRTRQENPEWSEWFKPDWLLGLTVYPENQGIWRDLTHSILASSESPLPPEADEALRRFSVLIPKAWTTSNG